MHVYGLGGAHKQQIHIFPTYFAFQRSRDTVRESLQLSEPDRLGGGRGRVTLPLVGLFEGFRVWRVWCWLKASTRLESRGPGGFGG